MENNIISRIRKELGKKGDEKTRESGKHFFKEEVLLHGLKTAEVTKISKEYFKEIKGLSKDKIFSLCESLWQSGYMEEGVIACNWAYAIHKLFDPQDLTVFENWIEKYVGNWAACDTLCNHTVGTFIEMYPDSVESLKVWAKSTNRWMKRASAVTLIIPARHGKFLNDIMEIADILLLDPDDMVQKGYGWMLKATSEAHQDEIFRYVVRNKAVMPRTALRYAIEKMPAELKKTAMERPSAKK